jgi:hypothetical protein
LLAGPHPRPIRFPKLVDYDDEAGRFLYDRRYAENQPDLSSTTTKS